jgi:DNA-binding transcriptional regulator LsrR (DeoR family)
MHDDERDYEKQLIAVATGFFQQSKSQKTLAANLRKSPATISRMLGEAKRLGIVQVSICASPQTELIARLKEHLDIHDCRIETVIVVDGGRHGVAAKAARYCNESLVHGDTVVLDGGLTIADFVESMVVDSRRVVNLSPIAGDPSSYKVSAYENMTILARKFSLSQCIRVPQSTVKLLENRLRKSQQAARKAKHVYLGAGPWRKGATAHDFLLELGLDPRAISRKYTQIAAVTGYFPISRNGEYIEIRELSNAMPRALSFKEVRTMSTNKDTRVVLLAHSAAKCVAVASVLRTGLINTLIVDMELAKALLLDVA